jgi:hypothetical protein
MPVIAAPSVLNDARLREPLINVSSDTRSK